MDKYYVAPDTLGFCVVSDEFCKIGGNYYKPLSNDVYETRAQAEQATTCANLHESVVTQLSDLINKKGVKLDGWFDETVEKLCNGEVVNNISIDGEWVYLSINDRAFVYGTEEKGKKN